MRYLRLKKKKEFSAVLKTGTRAHAGSLTLVYMPSDTPKMAVCVGKKYGKSVVRNRIKRLLRAAFFDYSEKLLPCSILLIPHVREEYTFHAFSRDIGKILIREHLIES